MGPASDGQRGQRGRLRGVPRSAFVDVRPRICGPPMKTLVAGCAALWDLIGGADKVPEPGSVGSLQAGPGVFGQWLPGGAAPTVALAMAVGGCQVALWHPLPNRERGELAFRYAASDVDLSRCPPAPWAGHCVVLRTETEALLWSSQT